MSIVSLRGIALFVVVFLDFSCGCATIPETLCGPDFREYFSFSFFYLWSSAKYLPGGNASDLFFSVFVLSQKAFWLCFPLVSGQEFLALGWFFSRVSPIPFLGLVWLFWVWCHPSLFWARFGFFGCGLLDFLAFFPCVCSVPGLPGLF